MDIRTLTDDLSVTGQITQDQLAQIAAQGFRAIICNRPDGEEPEQPSFVQIEQAARAAGLEARYLPVTQADLTDDNPVGLIKTMFPANKESHPKHRNRLTHRNENPFLKLLPALTKRLLTPSS